MCQLKSINVASGTPVAAFLRVTVAPETTEPEGSVTVPVIPPLSTCAEIEAGRKIAVSRAAVQQPVRRADVAESGLSLASIDVIDVVSEGRESGLPWRVPRCFVCSSNRRAESGDYVSANEVARKSLLISDESRKVLLASVRRVNKGRIVIYRDRLRSQIVVNHSCHLR
jgi:hypothetical protein